MDVTKTLLPGLPGTRRLMETYGAMLLFVRYRQDKSSGRRIKTVELIVEDYLPHIHTVAHRRNTLWENTVLLRIGYGETALRRRVKDAGGRCLIYLKLWQLPKDAARELRLLDRAVPMDGQDIPTNRNFRNGSMWTFRHSH